MLLEATTLVKPRTRGRSPLNTVFAAINELPTPVKIGVYGTVGLATIAILSGCGSQGTAVVTHEIAQCEGQTEVDLAPRSLEKITAKKGGINAEVLVNNDNTITINGITMDIQPNKYFFGDRNQNHLVLEVQGDTDDDGRINIGAKSVCPSPPPTPMPTPPRTK